MDSRTSVRNQPIAPTPTFVAQNVSSTAVAFSGVTHETLQSNKQNVAWVTSSADLRYRWDGVSPTTTVGHIFLAAGSPLRLVGRKKILNFRFIGNGGGAAVVSTTFDNTADAGGLN